ncbi:hypothetical protein PR048_006630 [Dryococelus australis]|uniref:Uncharacterized protein n=1 Tax=Dryococelus australis TaxID=614101 RepID=A0ABQ9IBH4_9NEOP|nr:hypothetical protein PR048_006630 [Dryococelus australis]
MTNILQKYLCLKFNVSPNNNANVAWKRARPHQRNNHASSLLYAQLFCSGRKDAYRRRTWVAGGRVLRRVAGAMQMRSQDSPVLAVSNTPTALAFWRDLVGSELLTVDEDEARPPRKPAYQAASSGTVPTCENRTATPPEPNPSVRKESQTVMTKNGVKSVNTKYGKSPYSLWLRVTGTNNADSTRSFLGYCNKKIIVSAAVKVIHMFVHWLLPHRVANVTSRLAIWHSLLVSLQVCYWLRVVQGVSNKLRSNCNDSFSVHVFDFYLDKINFKLIYTDVTFSHVSEFIRHTLDDSAPIADLQALVHVIPVDDVGTLRNHIVAACETIRNFSGIHQHILVSMQRRQGFRKVRSNREWTTGLDVTSRRQREHQTRNRLLEESELGDESAMSYTTFEKQAPSECKSECLKAVHHKTAMGATEFSSLKITGSPLEVPPVHAELREHCTPVQSPARKDDGAPVARASVTLMDPALLSRIMRKRCRLNSKMLLPCSTSDIGRELARFNPRPGHIGFSHGVIVPLVGGFSRGSPVSLALSFRRSSILTSITLIDSQDLDVKSRSFLKRSLYPEEPLPSSALKTSMLRAVQMSPLLCTAASRDLHCHAAVRGPPPRKQAEPAAAAAAVTLADAAPPPGSLRPGQGRARAPAPLIYRPLAKYEELGKPESIKWVFKKSRFAPHLTADPASLILIGSSAIVRDTRISRKKKFAICIHGYSSASCKLSLENYTRGQRAAFLRTQLHSLTFPSPECKNSFTWVRHGSMYSVRVRGKAEHVSERRSRNDRRRLTSLLRGNIDLGMDTRVRLPREYPQRCVSLEANAKLYTSLSRLTPSSTRNKSGPGNPRGFPSFAGTGLRHILDAPRMRAVLPSLECGIRREQCRRGAHVEEDYKSHVPSTSSRTNGDIDGVSYEQILERKHFGGTRNRDSRSEKHRTNMVVADLPWRSRLVRHQSVVREALGSNPGLGMDDQERDFDTQIPVTEQAGLKNSTRDTRAKRQRSQQTRNTNRVTGKCRNLKETPHHGIVRCDSQSYTDYCGRQESGRVSYLFSSGVLFPLSPLLPLYQTIALSRVHELRRAQLTAAISSFMPGLHHHGSKLDPRSDLRSTQKTVAPFEFRAGLEILMKFISNRHISAVRNLDPRSAAITGDDVGETGHTLAALAVVGGVALRKGPVDQRAARLTGQL